MASFNAIKVTQNSKDFFITSVKSSILRELAFVLKRDEDPIKGFQRLLNENRAKDITFECEEGKVHFYSSNSDYTPTANFNNEKRSSFENYFGSIDVETEYTLQNMG